MFVHICISKWISNPLTKKDINRYHWQIRVKGYLLSWRSLRSNWMIRNVWQSSGSYLMDKTSLDSLLMFPLGSKQSAVTWDITLTIGSVNPLSFTRPSSLTNNQPSHHLCLTLLTTFLRWVPTPTISRLAICMVRIPMAIVRLFINLLKNGRWLPLISMHWVTR